MTCMIQTVRYSYYCYDTYEYGKRRFVIIYEVLILLVNKVLRNNNTKDWKILVCLIVLILPADPSQVVKHLLGMPGDCRLKFWLCHTKDRGAPLAQLLVMDS